MDRLLTLLEDDDAVDENEPRKASRKKTTSPGGGHGMNYHAYFLLETCILSLICVHTDHEYLIFWQKDFGTSMEFLIESVSDSDYVVLMIVM